MNNSNTITDNETALALRAGCTQAQVNQFNCNYSFSNSCTLATVTNPVLPWGTPKPGKQPGQDEYLWCGNSVYDMITQQGHTHTL